MGLVKLLMTGGIGVWTSITGSVGRRGATGAIASNTGTVMFLTGGMANISVGGAAENNSTGGGVGLAGGTTGIATGCMTTILGKTSLVVEETTNEVCRAELNFNEVDTEADDEAKVVVAIIGNSILVKIVKDDSNKVALEVKVVVVIIGNSFLVKIVKDDSNKVDLEAKVVVVIIGNSFLVKIVKDDSNVNAELIRRVELVSAIDVKDVEVDIEAGVEVEVVVVAIGKVLNRRVEVVSAIDIKNSTKDEDKPLAIEAASILHKLMPHWVIIAFEDPRMHKLFPPISN
jgi:hypothetical protein